MDELIQKFTEARRNNLKVMVTEVIPGTDDHLFHYRSYIGSDGKILAEMCTQKIRQHPPAFGVARVAKTVPMIDEIKKLTLKILSSLSFHGLSSAEFKFDERDRQFKLMEINVRPVLSERLTLAAGINLPYITYLDRVKEIRMHPPTYYPDVYWIDNFMDIMDFFKWRKEENYSFGEYIQPYREKKVFCVPFLDDPLPFTVKSFIIGKRIVKNLISRMHTTLFRRGGQSAYRSR
jgi:predicted ATP-grasp superfamily ATP-dependent carboligase